MSAFLRFSFCLRLSIFLSSFCAFIGAKKVRFKIKKNDNTIDLLLACNLVQKHQFGKNLAQYEKSHGSKQHDHVICTDSGEVFEFCDPRIQQIKETVEELFGLKIQHHSLYFYGVKEKKQ